MLRLILGRARTGKTGRVMRQIGRRAAAGQGGSVLLVPEQYSHEAERELCAVCGDGLSRYAEVLSFTGLCRRVEDETGRPETMLDQGGRLLCMTLALQGVEPKLQTFHGAGRRAELQRTLLAAADELKSACVTPEALEQAAAQTGPPLSEKLHDLALVTAAYDAVTARSGADPADRLTRLAERIGHSSVGPGQHFFIDGFIDFTRQELEVLRALLAAGAELTVCLTCDGLEGTNEMFAASRRTARLLLEAARSRGLETAVETCAPPEERSPLQALEAHLFDYTAERFNAAGRVLLVRADGVTQECEYAAARCRQLVRETGCRWRDIAVAVRGYDTYRPALEAAFARYGVPLFSACRHDLLSRPLPALVAAAFEVLQGGWEAADVMDLLRTDLFGLTPDETDALENYVLLWSVRGRGWLREWSMHPGGWGMEETDESRAALERLNALRARVAGPLQRLAEAGRETGTAAGQCAALAKFFEDIALPQRLQARAGALGAEGRAALAAEYAQLWGVMVQSLEQAAAVLGETPMEQEAFSKLYLLLLSQYDVGLIPVSLDQVSAGDMDRARRRGLRHLIVLGASDERLPRPAEDAGVLTDAERTQLGALGIELGGAEEDVGRELGLIYNCLTMPSETLCVVWPAAEEPSLVVTRLAALYGLEPTLPSADALRSEAAAPALELAAAALHGGGGAAGRAALAYFDADGRAKPLRAAAEACRGSLSERAAQALYGKRPRLSATGLEKLSSCRFAYYLQYGLRARPRRPAGFQPPEMGTFLHFVLENVARALKETDGFDAPERAAVDRLTDGFIREYVSRTLNDFRDRTPRFIYLFGRLRETVRRIVWDMVSELARSDFRPLAFELEFDCLTQSRPDAPQLQLRGKIDRVDGWAHDGKLYLRVMDYKTGSKSFSLEDVWYGMNLQMLLYLFALARRDGPFGENVVPAGVLYVPARDKLVSAQCRDDEQAQKKRSDALRRSGLLLSDAAVLEAMEHGGQPMYLPVKYDGDGAAAGAALASAEQLGALSRHIELLLSRMAGELRHGGIAADPWFRSAAENACATCDFRDACHFDEETDRRRVLEKLKAPEVWQRIGEEVRHG